ncbi:hypothetical protein BJQ94_02415 [Cryobacterium sp. SO2]|uniref:hypothetical protein n=1 Tax=Cryobacterium sp. SO2 TaxID=1897060 RepID=UPI00223CA624|nr:hypothetical protein [Cryobacterium sp. SO2]WEO77919.1 hypothetical protein BJQ94_02415 [Cryobacterium sp. SO2]
MTAPQSALTHPLGLEDLEAHETARGRVAVTGHATYRGVRVGVKGVSPRGPHVEIYGPVDLPDILWRQDDVQAGFTSGDVEFSALDRFRLTRTTTHDAVDEHTPRPGVFVDIAGVEFGVADTCGTVGPDGVPLLQVMWVGEGSPVGDGWVLDGYGQWTQFVERARVASVRHVEWTAVWRDLTVFVDSISGDTALVFAARGGIPEFDVPEIVHGPNTRSGWSAVVPLNQLNLRSWTSVERPVGVGCVAGDVGLVGGRTVRVARAENSTTDRAGFVAQKLRGETVTEEYVVHPRTGRVDSMWEWRATLDGTDLHDIRHITTTATWKGQTRPVVGVFEAKDLVFFEKETADLSEVSELDYTATPVRPSELPLADVLW